MSRRRAALPIPAEGAPARTSSRAGACAAEQTRTWPLAEHGNGWNRAAPQKTQGAQFSASTVGYTGIKFQCQVSCSTQGVSAAQPQYTTDGSTWIDFGSPSTGTATISSSRRAACRRPRNFGVNLDFSAISAANNNPNFGVRITSIFDPRTRAPRRFPRRTTRPRRRRDVPYNNSSGNWRIGLITFSGKRDADQSGHPGEYRSGSRVRGQDNTVTFKAWCSPASTPPLRLFAVYADLSSIGLSNHQQLAGKPLGDVLLVHAASFPRARSSSPRVRPRRSREAYRSQSSDAQGRSASSNAAISFFNCNARTLQAAWSSARSTAAAGASTCSTRTTRAHTTPIRRIYNRSASPVNLNGWSVQYASPASSGGFSSSNNQVNLSGTIQSHQYMLIRFSDPIRGFPRCRRRTSPRSMATAASATTAGASSCRVRPRLSARRTPARTSKTSSVRRCGRDV